MDGKRFFWVPVSAGSDDGRRGGKPTRGRHPARRTDLSSADKHSVGRSGQQNRVPGPRLLSQCRRLYNLREDASGQIIDAKTEEPVSNAKVRLVEPSPENTTVTDEQGQSRYELDVDSTVTVNIISEFSFNVSGVNEEPNPIRRPVFITIRASTQSGIVSTVQLQGRKEKTVQ